MSPPSVDVPEDQPVGHQEADEAPHDHASLVGGHLALSTSV